VSKLVTVTMKKRDHCSSGMLFSTDWLPMLQDNLSLTTLADRTHSSSWNIGN